MIKFTTFSINGFCSIQNITLNLDGSGITIIRGNVGSGKSSILNALTWVLYGKTLKGKTDVNTKDKVKPKDYKGTMVEIFWEQGDQIHHIYRCSNYTLSVNGAKGGNRLVYEIDGSNADVKGKLNIQKVIEESLGMTFNLFKNSITFGQRLKRIAQESGPDKKALFEEAFDIGYITQAKQIANKLKNDWYDKVKELSVKINSLNDSYKETRSTYKDLRKREKGFKKLQEEEKKELLEELSEVQGRIDKIGKLNEKLRAKTVRFVSRYQKELEQVKLQYSQNKEALEEYTDEDEFIAFVNKILKYIKDKKYSKAEKALLNLSSVHKRTSALVELKNDLSNKISKFKDDLRGMDTQAKEKAHLSDKKDSLIKKINSINKETERVISKGLKSQLTKTKLTLVKNRKTLKKVTRVYENYKWVVDDPLGNSGIKTFIFDNSLDMLNQCLSDYADILGILISFTIDQDSKKRDFITTISKDGESYDYDELSGGEDQLVDIAMAFAIHQVTTSTKGMNILFLDELFENLDKTSIDLVTELIKYISGNKSIYVITHRDNFHIADSKKIRVSKENGVTTIQ